MVLLDSTLSKSQYDYTLPQVSFTAIGYHKHITLVFSPTVSTKYFHVPVFTLGAVFGVITCMYFVLLAKLSVSVTIKRFMSGINLDLLCVQLPVEWEGDMKLQQEVKGADVPERFCAGMAAVVGSQRCGQHGTGKPKHTAS